MPTKLKIKMGHIEFEYEGEAPYDTESVKDLFTHLETLMSAAPPGTFDAPPPSPPPSNGAIEADALASSDLGSWAPNTIAARLSTKTGTDVAIAAAAYLQICTGKNMFSRDELRTNMQAQTGYYNAGMSGNLTKILKALIASKRINSLANDQMSLSAGEMASLKAKLAES
jgi:hypothetical protein